MSRRALITGITGQDGSYLAELLLQKGYEVHGMVRRVALENPEYHFRRITKIRDRLKLHSATLENLASLQKVFKEVEPNECYHLAAQSFVSYSFEDEFSTMQANIDGTHYVLSALKDLTPDCRFYFAGSSEMIGETKEIHQSESTPFHPRSTYGISKAAAYYLTQHYREAYGIHASSGILYNHESPRRGHEFVTRKISSYAAKIKLGLCSELRLGNLDSRRDWGHSRDYVKAMWAMLQQDSPDDYVVASGKSHSVKEFCDMAFSTLDMDYNRYIVIDETLFRPAEIHHLAGDASKAKRVLKWEPSVSFNDLVKEMVLSDLEMYGREASN